MQILAVLPLAPVSRESFKIPMQLFKELFAFLVF